MGAIKVLIGLWLLSILSANASSIPAVQSVRITDEQSDYNQDSNESKAYIKDRWGTRGYSAKSDSEQLDESSSSLVSDATGTTKTGNARGFANEAESLNTFSVSADGRQKSKFASERAASEAYDKKKFEYVGADGTVVKNEESDESESSSTSTSSTTVVESPPAEVPPDHKGHHQKVWVNVDVPDVPGSGETDWSVEEKFETLENGVPCVLMKFVAKKPKKSTVISSSSSSSHNAHHSSKSSTSITPGSPNVGPGGPRYLGPPVVAPRDSGTVAVPASSSPIIIQGRDTTSVGSLTTTSATSAGPNGAQSTSGGSVNVGQTSSGIDVVIGPSSGSGSPAIIVQGRDTTQVASANSNGASVVGSNGAQSTSGGSVNVGQTSSGIDVVIGPGNNGGSGNQVTIVQGGDTTQVGSTVANGASGTDGNGAWTANGGSSNVGQTTSGTDLVTTGNDNGWYGPGGQTTVVQGGDTSQVGSTVANGASGTDGNGASTANGGSSNVGQTTSGTDVVIAPNGGSGSPVLIVQGGDTTQVGSTTANGASGTDLGQPGPIVIDDEDTADDWTGDVEETQVAPTVVGWAQDRRPIIIPRRRCRGSICICYGHVRDIPRQLRRQIGL